MTVMIGRFINITMNDSSCVPCEIAGGDVARFTLTRTISKISIEIGENSSHKNRQQVNKVDERPSDWPIGCSSGGVSNCRPIYLPPHPVMWYVTSNASHKLPALFMQRVYIPTYLVAAGFNATNFRFFFSCLSLFLFTSSRKSLLISAFISRVLT